MSSPLACFVAMRHRLMWWEPFFFCSDSGPSSSSFCRLYFVLRFWNHTFTWAREGGAQVRNTQEAPRAATGPRHPGRAGSQMAKARPGSSPLARCHLGLEDLLFLMQMWGAGQRKDPEGQQGQFLIPLKRGKGGVWSC